MGRFFLLVIFGVLIPLDQQIPFSRLIVHELDECLTYFVIRPQDQPLSADSLFMPVVPVLLTSVFRHVKRRIPIRRHLVEALAVFLTHFIGWEYFDRLV